MENRIMLDQARYEELLDLETRVNVVCQMTYRESSFGKKEIFSILGTDLAMKVVRKIEEEDKRFYDSIKSEMCLVEAIED